jgi:hypothetical protein
MAAERMTFRRKLGEMACPSSQNNGGAPAGSGGLLASESSSAKRHQPGGKGGRNIGGEGKVEGGKSNGWRETQLFRSLAAKAAESGGLIMQTRESCGCGGAASAGAVVEENIGVIHH